jgi:glycosyltransferase involved in cell wall biosynthesis
VLKVLVFTTLYPNPSFYNHGIFVENRVRNTAGLGDIDFTVLAPVPYFPMSGAVFGRYGKFARVCRQETRHQLEVHHPSYLIIPKVGMIFGPQLLYQSARRTLRRLTNEGRRFDVIDAHYFYPDGVAAALLAKEFEIPLVVTARGSDITQIAKFAIPRKQITSAARDAFAVVAVCEALRRDLLELGVDASRTVVLRNGVDLETFIPHPPEPLRERLNLNRFTLISVGGLVPRKGHELAIRSLCQLTDCDLLIVGEGPDRRRLETLAKALSVAERVRMIGEVAHADLPKYYSACQASVLMSEREGWANVILESLACGTPVLGSDVGGTREIIQSPLAGFLLPERTVESLVTAVGQLRHAPPNRSDTRRYAQNFGWDAVARANKCLLEQAAAGKLDLSEVTRRLA